MSSTPTLAAEAVHTCVPLPAREEHMSDEDVHLRLVEVVAETAHGRIEIHANEHDIFEARHVLYNGGVEYLPWHPSRTFGGETAARRACLNFFENWKKRVRAGVPGVQIAGDGMSDMSGVVCGLETVFGFGTVPGWTDLEVLATTAHGVLYLRKDSSEFFLIHHVLHDGTVQWICNGTVWPDGMSPRHSDEDFARQGAAEFLLRWKKEFALEHLAYSLAQSATDG